MGHLSAVQATDAPLPAAAVRVSIDAIDLMFELAELETPDPLIDQVVEVLIARGDYRRSIRPSDVRFNSWLASEVRPYTAGGPSLHVLAHRLGYRLNVTAVSGGYAAVALDVNSGRSAKANAKLEGAAGVLALLRMAYGDRHG